MTQHATFTLGVNYWPRKKAMYWWKDFDRAEVEAEFGEIIILKDHGADFLTSVIRFQEGEEFSLDKAG